MLVTCFSEHVCDVCLQEDDDGEGSAMGGEFATQVGRVTGWLV